MKVKSLGEKVCDALQAHTKRHGKLQPATWRETLTKIVNDCAASPASVKSKIIQIYEAYPRKVGREYALKCIERACKKTDPDFILQRTQMFAQAVSKWPHQYRFDRDSGRDLVPNPSTWFNQGRFMDDPNTWTIGSNGASVVATASKTPPEPNDWVDRFLEAYASRGWEKIDNHTVYSTGRGHRRWPDLGPLGLWEEFK